jgi:hypothetical protein
MRGLYWPVTKVSHDFVRMRCTIYCIQKHHFDELGSGQDAYAERRDDWDKVSNGLKCICYGSRLISTMV